MTVLETFMKTTGGMAVAAAVAVVVGHSQAPQAVQAPRAAPAAETLDVSSWMPAMSEIGSLERRAEVMEGMIDRLADRNEALNWMLVSFADLHDELVDEVMSGPAGRDERETLGHVADRMLHWLDGMRAGPVPGYAAPALTAMMASSPSPTGMEGVDGQVAELRNRMVLLASVINDITEENRRLETLASGVVVELDGVIRAARDPRSDLAEVSERFQRYADYLVEYEGHGEAEEASFSR